LVVVASHVACGVINNESLLHLTIATVRIGGGGGGDGTVPLLVAMVMRMTMMTTTTTINPVDPGGSVAAALLFPVERQEVTRHHCHVDGAVVLRVVAGH
jgi:hypothetical protein